MVLKTALILAGGKGTRLNEYTEDLPKPLVPIKDKPILERIIEWLRDQGVERVILGLAYKKEMIQSYFGDGSDFGIKINYVFHDSEGGTEDAFKTDIEQAFEKGWIEEDDFYAMNGDQITDLDLENFSKEHLEKNSVVTIAAINLRTNFGVLERDEKGKIVEFSEKGALPDKFMNSGIYIFNKRIRNYLLEGNIEENAFGKLVKDNLIYSYYHKGMWLTVNDKKELKKAEETLENLEK